MDDRAVLPRARPDARCATSSSALTRELLGDDEPVSAELAEHVELTLQRNGDDLVVHLINLSGARRKNYGPPIRTARRHAAACQGGRAARPPRRLWPAPPATTRRDGEDLVFSLPELERFEVVLIETDRTQSWTRQPQERPTTRADPQRAGHRSLSSPTGSSSSAGRSRPRAFVHCDATDAATIERALRDRRRGDARRRPRRPLRRGAEPQMGALRPFRPDPVRAARRVRQGTDRHRVGRALGGRRWRSTASTSRWR